MTRVELEAFELVLLRTPENAPAYDDAELARIQAEHLAHHARLRASGQVVTKVRFVISRMCRCAG